MPAPTEERQWTKGETPCLQRHHEGYLCTRPRGHRGLHVPFNSDGKIVEGMNGKPMRFRGGRAYWPQKKEKVNG